MFLQADRLKDAINSLAAIGEWERAKRVVRELAPDLEYYLEEKYKEAMIREDQMDKLAEVDAEAALEILVRKGQWSQVFEAAGAKSSALLHKYVALRAAQLLKSDSPIQSLQLYVQYGTPPIPQNYNLYYHLAETILNSEETYNEYRYLAQLRDALMKLIKNLENSEHIEKFDRLFRAAHYSSFRCAMRMFPPLSGLAVKSSIVLLRYSDMLFADRCYYEAGIDARSAGLSSEAFVFLNHFLDLEECIEEGDGSILDVDDLRVTDFPLEVPLPSRLSLSKDEREEVREWVLTVSMDQKVEQGLPTDHRGTYIGSLTSSLDKSNPLQECALTGYPIRGSVVRFEGTSRVADREDWNKLVNSARQAPPDSHLNDILVFIQEWCGAIPNYSF